jgi:hypothetical protein
VPEERRLAQFLQHSSSSKQPVSNSFQLLLQLDLKPQSSIPAAGSAEITDYRWDFSDGSILYFYLLLLILFHSMVHIQLP